jgi:hypothetical protein
MVMLLRSRGVPSRLVTGFQRGELNALVDVQVVRKSDAHAWVEVFDEQSGWVGFDPTPPAPAGAESSSFTILYQGIDSFRVLWEMYVVAFDHDRQRGVFGELGARARAFVDAGGRLLRAHRRNAEFVAGTVLLLVLIFWLGRSRFGRIWRLKLRIPWPFRRAVLSSRPESAVRFYENLLRHLEGVGFVKPAGMTPEEFAGSLEGRLPGLTELTRMYYGVRYGAQELDSRQQARAERLVTAVQLTALSMTDLAYKTKQPNGSPIR